MSSERVLIRDAVYIPNYHLMIWDLQFIDPNSNKYQTIQRVAYRADDLVRVLLGNPDVTVTPEQAVKFSEEIKGKEKNFSMSPEISNQAVESAVNLDSGSASEMSARLSEYPTDELAQLLGADMSTPMDEIRRMMREKDK